MAKWESAPIIEEPKWMSAPTVERWKSAPIDKPVGFVEAFFKEPEKKFPFSPIAALETADVALSARRLQKNLYEKPPLLRPAGRVGVRQMGAWAVEYGPEWTPERQREQDVRTVTEYFEKLDEEQRRGYTTGGRVGQITSAMPAFMVEFILTGGLKAIGTKTGKKAAARALGKYASTTAGKASIATGGFAMGTTVRAAGMPHRAANSILRRQVPQDIQISDDGEVKITGPVESPMTSLWKGLTDHWIEVASEDAGEVIAPYVSKYFKDMPLMGRFTNALRSRWLRKFPNKTTSDFTKKILRPGGFHGVITEVGEEYLGDITKAITDVEHFGAGEDANMLERITAGVQQDNALLVPMLISFSIPGAIGKSADIVERRQAAVIQKRRKEIEGKYNSIMELAEEAAEAGETISFEEFEEQFNKYRFDTPGIGTIFTPKWLVNRMLGMETILEDVDKAELARVVEERDINSWISKLVHRLKKEKDLARLPEVLKEEVRKEAVEVEPLPDDFPGGYVETAEGIIGFPRDIVIQEIRDVEVTKPHILQTKIDSDKPVEIMRDLVDTYEEAPEFLTKSETKIFNEIRELTRYLRTRANMVRERMGLEPIGDVKGYITHWMDAVANRVVGRDVSIHSGYLYYLMKGLPKEIKNPTAMKRKIKNGMEKYFSKDLGKLLRIMTAMDLRDIHLMQPYQAAWDELQQLRAARLIPQSTFGEVEKYLLYDIRKFQAPMDKKFNKTFRKPFDLLNIILPAKRVVDDPARAVFGNMRRLGHVSGLGLRLRPAGRNLGQRLLLLDLYRHVDYAKAQAVAFRLADMPVVKHPVTGKDVPLIDLIRDQDWYKAALRKFEDITTAITGVEQSALYLYGKTHIGNLFLSNVEVSAITGYFDWLNMYNQSQNTKSDHFKNVIKQAKRLGVPADQLLTQESDMMWNIREAVRRTQWEYFSISMPTFYRGEFNRAMGLFQSWWMNYFFNHSREMINQVATGRNSLGRLLTPYGRMRALKGVGTIVAIGKASKALFGIEMLKYLFAPVPSYWPPIPELIRNLILFFAATDNKERKRAFKGVKRSLAFWIPFSAFGRDLNRLLSGEYDIADFIFYRPKPREK